MKRLVLSAIAFSMLAVPAMQAQAAPMNAPLAPQANVQLVAQKHVVKERVVVKKHVVKKRYGVNKRVVHKKVVVHKSHWKRGQKYPGWRQHRPVRDYRHYGLHRPGRGQEWIRVGNDYLLVSFASGVIAGMIAAR